jgi:hypothetical protein
MTRKQIREYIEKHYKDGMIYENALGITRQNPHYGVFSLKNLVVDEDGYAYIQGTGYCYVYVPKPSRFGRRFVEMPMKDVIVEKV